MKCRRIILVMSGQKLAFRYLSVFFVDNNFAISIYDMSKRCFSADELLRVIRECNDDIVKYLIGASSIINWKWRRFMSMMVFDTQYLLYCDITWGGRKTDRWWFSDDIYHNLREQLCLFWIPVSIGRRFILDLYSDSARAALAMIFHCRSYYVSTLHPRVAARDERRLNSEKP